MMMEGGKINAWIKIKRTARPVANKKHLLSSLILFILITTISSSDARPRQKWCGTDAKNIFGLITSHVPEYSPSTNSSATCPGRRAELWKSCRAHDECEWHLGKPLKWCHEAFLKNLKRECHKTFVALPNKLKEGCAAHANSCNQTAYLYYVFMLKGDFLTNSGNGAKADSRRVLGVLKRKLGNTGIRQNRRFLYNRIAYYCPRFKDNNNDCRTNYVAGRVIFDLENRR